jgi:hypothetical protein
LIIRQHEKGALLQVWLQSRAAKQEIVGIFGDSLKVKVSEPPISDKANKALIEYLAKILAVPKSRVFIWSGRKTRRKQILILWASASEIEAKIKRCLAT